MSTCFTLKKKKILVHLDVPMIAIDVGTAAPHFIHNRSPGSQYESDGGIKAHRLMGYLPKPRRPA